MSLIGLNTKKDYKSSRILSIYRRFRRSPQIPYNFSRLKSWSEGERGGGASRGATCGRGEEEHKRGVGCGLRGVGQPAGARRGVQGAERAASGRAPRQGCRGALPVRPSCGAQRGRCREGQRLEQHAPPRAGRIGGLRRSESAVPTARIRLRRRDSLRWFERTCGGF